MNEPTTLFLGPEENLSILKEIFSARKSSAEEIAKKIGKNKGTILNALHDLRILKLVDANLEIQSEARNIIYDRNAIETIKNRFIEISGNKEAINEITSSQIDDPLEIGKIFCFHTNARATKESSLKQIGRLYNRWLKFLNLFNYKSEVSQNE